MGKVGKAIAKPFEHIGHAISKHVIAPILGVGGSSGTTVEYAGGAAAAAPAADAQNNDTNVDTDATKRKKKAMGKKSLMIGNGSDTFGGGTTGTGLNL